MNVSGLSRPPARGFTIVELLVTVVIVSILASAAFPMAELTIKRNKEQELRRTLLQLREALDAYKQAADQGHVMLQPGESGYPHSLESMVDGVVDAKSPAGVRLYFLRRVPRDPFSEDAAVAASETWGKRSYASSHAQPKAGADVYDVYPLDTGIGLNGIPYREW